MALITCEKVSLSYDNRCIIKDLSFSVNSGEYLCIVGENGSGKSTLIKALLGLKSLNEGKIVFGEGLRSNEIGYLPQKSDMQNDFPASVWEIVLSGRLNSHPFFSFYTKEDKQIANNNIAKLGIDGIKHKSFSELSGGQQQRALLARALCATKKLILLDEPTSKLDPLAISEFYSMIKKLNTEGITVIMVSHDLIPAVKSSTRVLRFDNKGHQFFSPNEFLQSLSISEETEND